VVTLDGGQFQKNVKMTNTASISKLQKSLSLKYHRLKNTAQAGGHLGHIKALKWEMI
jgi:hypothetical protein